MDKSFLEVFEETLVSGGPLPSTLLHVPGSSLVVNVLVTTIIQRRNRYLMIEQATKQGLLLDQPKGEISVGENLWEAAIRVVADEVGLVFSPQGLVNAYHWIGPRRTRARLWLAVSGGIDRCDQASKPVRWCTWTELVARRENIKSSIAIPKHQGQSSAWPALAHSAGCAKPSPLVRLSHRRSSRGRRDAAVTGVRTGIRRRRS